MEIEYFMSSLASDVMGILSENFLWMRTLGSTPILESEVPSRRLTDVVLLAYGTKWSVQHWVFSRAWGKLS